MSSMAESRGDTELDLRKNNNNFINDWLKRKKRGMN